jgi:hypothetical protein
LPGVAARRIATAFLEIVEFGPGKSQIATQRKQTAQTKGRATPNARQIATYSYWRPPDVARYLYLLTGSESKQQNFISQCIPKRVRWEKTMQRQKDRRRLKVALRRLL